MEKTDTIIKIEKIQQELSKNGLVASTIVKEIKELREIFITLQQPRLTKVTRLIFEHIEAEGTFNIPMPAEEAEDEGEDVEAEEEVATEELSQEQLNVESLDYLLSLLKKPENKFNADEISAYIDALS